MKKVIKITTPQKSWWAGDPRIDTYMLPVYEKIKKHIKHPSNEFTEIYNACYEAMYKAVFETEKGLFNIE